MARKLDSSVALSREPIADRADDLVGAIVRVIAVWTSPTYQRGLSQDNSLPDGDNVIPAIYRLATHGGLRPSDLASELHASAAAASRLCDVLASAGISARVADADDSRSSVVVLTARGREIAEDLFRAGDTLMSTLLSSWSPEDRHHFARLMTRFAHGVEANAVGLAATLTCLPKN